MIRFLSGLIKRYRHVNWALADQTMVSGVNFITGILLARYLGIEEFGRFTLAWMAVLFVNSLQHALINSPMMSIGPKQTKAEMPSYYGAVFVQQAVFSGAAFVLLFAGVTLSAKVFPEWQVTGLALPLAAAALGFQFQDFLRRYFFTRERPAAAFASDAVRYLGQLALLVWLFFSFRDQMDTANVLWVIALAAVIATVGSGFFVEKIRLQGKVLRATALRHWRFSGWLGASALLQWAWGSLPLIVVSSFLGVAAAGALKATQNVVSITALLFQALENIAPIRATAIFKKGGIGALNKYILRLGGVIVVVVGSICILLSVFASPILQILYGPEYAQYSLILILVCVAYLVSSLAYPWRYGLRTLEQTKHIFLGYIVAALATLAAVVPLIKVFALPGAVFTLILAQVALVIYLANAYTKAQSKKLGDHHG